MAKLARLPLFFALEGRRAVVAGDTPAAAWKVELLSAAGAEVEVYASEPCEELLALAADPPRGSIFIHGRAWHAEDIRDAAIAIGACDSEEDALHFSAAARAACVPVNVIDKPKYCDFAFGAIVNRSPLVIGISTDGAAPVFAQAIRAKLEMMIPRGFTEWADAARRWRRQVQISGLSFNGQSARLNNITIDGSSNNDNPAAVGGSVFNRPRDFLADHRSHRRSEKTEIHHCDCHLVAVKNSKACDHSIEKSRALMVLFEPIFIGSHSLEAQDVHGS